MKKCVVVLFALVLCLFSAALTQPVWAADPGTRYSDAFVLIQQGQAAEEKSDLPTAYHKYQDALNILHSIRTEAPDWNAQMVEYRLKDCQSHFDAVKTKLPEPPPAPAAEAPVAVTPPVTVPDQQPVAAAPVVKTAIDNQSAKLGAQVETLQKENKDLQAKLASAEKQAATAKPADSAQLKKLRTEADSARAEADKAKKEASDLEKKNADLSSQVTAAKKEASQIADLQKQNQDLSAQLATAKKEASAKVVPPAPAPATDSAQLKKLRAETDTAHAEADKAKKEASDLEKQNRDLSAQLAAARKEASAKVTPPAPAPAADNAQLKKLRAEADSARTEADKARKEASDLEKKNAELNSQVATAKKQAADSADAKSAELKKLRTDLDKARADADSARKSASEVADLQKRNQDLSAKLAAAEKKASAQHADSAEVKSLRADLDKSHAEVADLKKQVAAKSTEDSAEVKGLRTQLADAHKELDQAKKSAGQVADLEKQNKDLSAQLAAARKEASAKVTPSPGDSAEVKKLREQLNAARADVDKGKQASARVVELEKQNAELSSKLAAEKKTADTAAAAEPADARVMKHLRNENSYLRNLLDKYAANNAELKGQLHHHDMNQPKTGD